MSLPPIVLPLDPANMTPAQAKTVQCPYSLKPVRGDNSAQSWVASNRHADGKIAAFCMANECAAWRWNGSRKPDQTGRCGFVPDLRGN